MKKLILLGIAGFTGLASLSQSAHAQINLEYKNGVHAGVSDAELSTLQTWAKNTGASIDNLLVTTGKSLDSTETHRKLLDGIKGLLDAPSSEADKLLRQALSVGLDADALIQFTTMGPGGNIQRTPEGTIDQQNRILKKSLQMARDYYKSEFEYVDGVVSRRDNSMTKPNLIDFGVRFSQFLIKMSDGVLSAPASYGLIRWSLGVLERFIYDDTKKQGYAFTISNLHTALRPYIDIMNNTNPTQFPSDTDCIRNIRELKLQAQMTYKNIEKETKELNDPKAPNNEVVYTPPPAPVVVAPAMSEAELNALREFAGPANAAVCDWFDGETHGIASREYHAYKIDRGIYYSLKTFGNDGMSSLANCKEYLYFDLYKIYNTKQIDDEARRTTCTCSWHDGEQKNEDLFIRSREWHMSYKLKMYDGSNYNRSVATFGNNGVSSQEACQRKLVENNFSCG